MAACQVRRRPWQGTLGNRPHRIGHHCHDPLEQTACTITPACLPLPACLVTTCHQQECGFTAAGLARSCWRGGSEDLTG
jgi:hypothetical protein